MFEPHGAFRTAIADTTWPLGYISEGPGKPIFALEECDWAGERSAEELIEAAQLASAAPELLKHLQFAVKLLRPLVGNAAQVQAMEAAIEKAMPA